MRHAKAFVKVPSSARVAPPQADVRDQKSEVSQATAVLDVVNDGADGAPSSHLTSDLRPLTSEPNDDPAKPAFDALRCPTCRAILHELFVNGGARAVALSERIGLPRGTIGRHLRDLNMLGFVKERQVGREHWYRPHPTRVLYSRDTPGYAYAIRAIAPSGVRVTMEVPARAAGDAMRGPPRVDEIDRRD